MCSWKQVGYTYVTHISAAGRTNPADCDGYGPDAGGCSGWYPDPLLPAPHVRVTFQSNCVFSYLDRVVSMCHWTFSSNTLLFEVYLKQ